MPTINGTEDPDVLTGTGENDTINGFAGDDTLHGQDGQDILDGGDGADTIYGGAGSDVLIGGEGDDYLDPDGSGFGGSRSETISAGGGNDYVWISGLYWGGAVTHLIDMGAGNDTLSFVFAPIGASVTIGPSTAGDSGFSGTVFVGNAEAINYSNLDTFILYTGSAADTIVGISNADMISTGAGNDTITAGGTAGRARINGGSDFDRISADWSDLTEAVVWDLNDPLGVTIGSGDDERYLIGVEGLNYFASGAGDDMIVLHDNIGSGTLLYDTLYTNGGDDVVSLRAAGASDFVHMGSGSDHLVLDFAGAFASALTVGPLTAEADGYSGSITGFGTVSFTGVDRFTITTSGGDDVIHAGDGDDEISAGAGNDEIQAAGGSDTVNGGAGNDRLIGGSGADTITGGEGRDTFLGSAAELNGDTITDFSASDRIVISDASLATFEYSVSGTTLAYSGGSLTFADVVAGAFVASEAPEGGVQLTYVLPTRAKMILTESGQDFAVGGDVAIFGTAASGEVIEVIRGNMLLDASFNIGGDTVVLPGNAGTYTAILSGSFVTIASDGISVAIPVGVIGLAVQFADSTRTLRFDVESGQVVLGTQQVTSIEAAVAASGPALVDPVETGPESLAKLILTEPGQDVDIGGNVLIFGTAGAGEVIAVLDGTVQLDASFNIGGDTVALPGNAAGYSATLSGSFVTIVGGDVSVAIPVGLIGLTVDFADVDLQLLYDPGSGQVMLGDQAVPSSGEGEWDYMTSLGLAKDAELHMADYAKAIEMTRLEVNDGFSFA